MIGNMHFGLLLCNRIANLPLNMCSSKCHTGSSTNKFKHTRLLFTRIKEKRENVFTELQKETTTQREGIKEKAFFCHSYKYVDQGHTKEK
jgi:hypothetical protein